MYVTVQIKPPAAAERSRYVPGQLPAELREAESSLGITIQPMHPGTTDPTLASYFYVDVPDQPAAERVIALLRQYSSVEAAFLKPPEGPP